jgi:hypothetical protein
MKAIRDFHLTIFVSGYILNNNNWRFDDSRELRRKIRYTGNLDQVSVWPLNRKIAKIIQRRALPQAKDDHFLWPFSLVLLGSAFGDAVYGTQC